MSFFKKPSLLTKIKWDCCFEHILNERPEDEWGFLCRVSGFAQPLTWVHPVERQVGSSTEQPGSQNGPWGRAWRQPCWITLRATASPQDRPCFSGTCVTSSLITSAASKMRPQWAQCQKVQWQSEGQVFKSAPPALCLRSPADLQQAGRWLSGDSRQGLCTFSWGFVLSTVTWGTWARSPLVLFSLKPWASEALRMTEFFPISKCQWGDWPVTELFSASGMYCSYENVLGWWVVVITSCPLAGEPRLACLIEFSSNSIPRGHRYWPCFQCAQLSVRWALVPGSEVNQSHPSSLSGLRTPALSRKHFPESSSFPLLAFFF